MNIVGKILVICNLLFALVVGFFLLFDFATRSNWKAGYDALQKEMIIARKHNETMVKTLTTATDQVKKLQNDLEQERVNRLESEALYKSKVADAEASKAESERIGTAAGKNVEKQVEDNRRLQLEVAEAIKTLGKSEERILALEKEVSAYRTKSIEATNAAEGAQRRNESLLEQLREKEAKIAELANPASKEVIAKRGALGVNPPPVRVKGQVIEVNDKNPSLVTISLGSDHGLKRDHTLEVYRFNPRPEYVGMIRILDAHFKDSIGQLMNGPTGTRPLQVGDVVADKIQN